MRDHVTEERISAYVDGELEGDELELVERLLAESAEYRQLLAELQELRASLQPNPSFNLPADFHKRIVDQIEDLDGIPPKELPIALSKESKRNPWRSVAVAVASLAAMIAVAVMLQPSTPDPIIPGGSGYGIAKVMPVYLRQDPKYVMVYDVTVTPDGQKNGAVDQLLKKLGIGIDPALRLDDQLEKELMAIRESEIVLGGTEATLYKNDQATPKSKADDKVEMIYVAGNLNTLDRFGLDLEQMRNDGKEVSQLHYDMVIEPNKLGVMHRLHDSAREHFAESSTIVPSDIGQAFRLSFHIELTSLSVPGTAMFPIPTIRAESATPGVNADGKVSAVDALGVMSRLNQSGDEDRGGGGSDGAGQPNGGGTEAGHILLILRNVGANADNKK
ncbi:MAG: hypothetical protein H8E66_15605 [Planctomycetes bacterium]|nr:hypothetical protein [Planctomycetota bacterium]